MTDQRFVDFERLLRQVAADFPYPPTPDLATGWSRESSLQAPTSVWPRLALAGLLLGIMAVAAVPSARATVLEIVQWGAVRLRFGDPAALPDLESPVTDLAAIDFGERASQAAVREVWGDAYRLPSSLDSPDRVYVQGEPAAGYGVISVWLDGTGKPEWALFQLSADVIYDKAQPTVIQQLQVADHPALWTTGPYLVRTESGGIEFRRLMSGHVLIWTDESFTYRLETEQPLAQTVEIARSLYEIH